MQTDRGTHDVAYLNAAIARCNRMLIRKLSLGAQIRLFERLELLQAKILVA